MVDQIIYGESLEDPGLYNARGQISKICDEAGVVSHVKYDFKGNLLCTERQLAKEYKKIVNWEQPVPLEDETFATQMSYDALSRTTQTTMPDKTIFRWQYNEASLLQSTIGNIRGADIPTSFIDNIEYNAKGQRLSIKYGNGVVTSYTHDALTTLLTHLTTRRIPRLFPNDSAKQHSASWPGSHIQNLHYTYDAIGNVTQIRDDAQQAIFFRNERVNPNNEYTFDAIYRLIEAPGREHLGLSKKPMKAIDSMSESADHPKDGKAMRTYPERFRYDEVGNVRHHGNGGSDDGWTRNYFYGEASLLEPRDTATA
jgi:YD repeat-containing protein